MNTSVHVDHGRHLVTATIRNVQLFRIVMELSMHDMCLATVKRLSIADHMSSHVQHLLNTLPHLQGQR